ncbi:signal transduction histidine-protein kinase BaeS [mine drainage metagenome]|uniref:histidine kinase n=1 Tax=mine drainage metagenome TaxID=410659 RepID=A0A1J5R4L8_9ZZZZ
MSVSSVRKGAGMGPLGRRMLLAFILVAVSSVVVLTVAALIGVGQGVEAVQQSERVQKAAAAAGAAGAAYQAAGGWNGADLTSSSAIAQAAGARLFVLDQSGSSVRVGPGMGQGAGGPGPGAQGSAQSNAQSSAQGAVTAPVVVDGVTVGTVRLMFGASSGTRARDIAWSWIAVAAAVALVVAVVASWWVTRVLTRPIDAMTTAARQFAAGDREARTGESGPGELGELAHAFNGMADTVARSERDRRNLTADVAHELRTPLAVLQAGLEELRDGLVEPTSEGLARLHDQSLRLGRIVQDLAELSAAEGLSAAEATESNAMRAEVDLGQVVADALAGHDPQLRAAGLVIVRELSGPAVVRADSDRLHQAVGNLLANVARYCRPGDEARVTVRPDGGDVVLVVADTGPGLPADEVPHVFDRLWRGRGTEHIAGSGIGLAVVREIVVAHGGTIDARSPAGGGLTVTIRLPSAPSSAPSSGSSLPQDTGSDRAAGTPAHRP